MVKKLNETTLNKIALLIDVDNSARPAETCGVVR